MGFSKGVLKPLRWRLTISERRLILLLGDLIMAFCALTIALYFWAAGDAWLNFSLQFLLERPPMWFFTIPFIWVVFMVEMYDVRRASRKLETLRGIAIAVAISFGFYLILYFTSEPNSLPRRGIAGFIIAGAVLTLIWRMIYINVFTAPLFLRRSLIIGAGRAGSTMVNIIRETKPAPFVLIGLIDDDPKKIGTSIMDYPVLGSCQKLMDIVKEEGITDLIFAISGKMSAEMLQAILLAEEEGIEVDTMPVVYEDLLGRVPIFLLESDWILRSFVDQAHVSGFYELAKSFVDLIGGLVGSLFFFVQFPFISLAILLDSGTPVLFKQTRLGKNGRTYDILKFRTMVKNAEKDGKAIMAVKNDERVTRLGRLLRKSHLDELPQFINVLRGDMSLVGPRAERPELVNELQKEIPFYRARLFVKPGLTGWAQVNFRYASTVEDTGIKLEYDLYYIKHRNLLTDFIILLRTTSSVFGLRGM